MRRLMWLCLLPGLLAAEDRWVKFLSGPYEVYTDAGARPGREALVRFEEFRHTLGQLVGETDLKTPEPIRILILKNPKPWAVSDSIIDGRACQAIVLGEKAPVSPTVYSGLTRLLLQANTAQMPPAFEHGLVEFLSTFSVTGIRITVGAPPPQPDLDWARVHLLVVDPEYYGRIRVLLYNLRRGVDEEPAYRNAFNKSRSEIEAQAKQHLAAGNFQTTNISSRPLAESDFQERAVSDNDARLVRADLLAGAASAAEYQKLIQDQVKIAEAEEGLGLLALREKQNDEARKHFAASTQAGSGSARAFIEYARLEPDAEKARQALLKAAGINPKLEEPFVLMAQRDTDPRLRLAHWKAATERNPRNPAYWKSLAECYLAENNYAEAAKAWRGGEQSATDPAERERMHQSRMAIEQQRLDYEEAEKRRKAEEEAREIEKLKAEARAEVHALETKYNKGSAQSDGKAVPWWDGPKPEGHITGALKQVDCLGTRARLLVESDDHKTVKLLVPDASKVALLGAGEMTLGCGAQKLRRVSIDYVPKTDARMGTAGEVATIEFQ